MEMHRKRWGRSPGAGANEKGVTMLDHSLFTSRDKTFPNCEYVVSIVLCKCLLGKLLLMLGNPELTLQTSAACCSLILGLLDSLVNIHRFPFS